MKRRFHIFLITLLFTQISSFGQATFDTANSFIYFDGVDDYLQLFNNNGFAGKQITNRTIEFWFNADRVKDRRVLFQEWGWNNNFATKGEGIICYVEDGVFYFGIYQLEDGKSKWFRTNKGDIQPKSWHHFAFVLDGTSTTLYLDGLPILNGTGIELKKLISQMVSSTEMSAFPSATASWTGNTLDLTSNTDLDIYVGTRNYFYEGNISLLRVWDVSRTETEINDNINTYLTTDDNSNILTFVDGTGLNSGTETPITGGEPIPVTYVEWEGDFNNDILEPQNWVDDVLPDLNSGVTSLVLKDGLTYYPHVLDGQDVYLFDLFVPFGETVSVNSGAFLDVVHAAYILGSLNIESDFYAKYSLVEDGASLNINDNSSLTIFEDLINEGSINIAPKGRLTLENSTSNLDNTLGSFVLNSDETGTGSLITKGTVSGDIAVERYIAYSGNGTISAPTQSNSSVFTGHFLLSHTESLANTNTPFRNIPTDGSYNLKDAEGYVFSIDEANFGPERVFNFTGTPNTGDYIVRLTNTEFFDTRTGITDFYGWSLVGNPYPSAITWTNIEIELPSELNSTMYMYDGNTNDWLTFNPNDPIETNTSEINNIPLGQAFFVRMNSDIDGDFIDITIKNVYRDHSNENVNFEPIAAAAMAKKSGAITTKKATVASTENYFEVEVKSQNNKSDKAYYVWRPDATSNFDNKFDSYKLESWGVGNPNIFFFTENKKTRIQQENSAELVKMGYSSTESGLVELSVPRVNTFNSLILEDIKTGETVDLLENSYYFEYDSNENFESGRFIVYINQNTLANEEFSNNDLNIYNRNNNLCLDLNKEIKNATCKIYDHLGREVISQKLNEKSSYFEFPVDLNNGIYIVEISTQNYSITKTIIFK